MTLLWWHWIVIGLLLVFAEMATAGGFYFIFFGAAAFVVGLLAGLHVTDELGVQLLLFSILSIGSLVIFRKRLLRRVQLEPQTPPVDALVGEIGTISEDLAPGSVGKIELRGTTWSARNATASTLAQGSRCRVVRVDGLLLHVEPEGARS